MSHNDTKRFNILHIDADKKLTDSEILLGAAFVCRHSKDNPSEFLEMLGLIDDLSRVRIGRRPRTDGKEAS